VASPGTILIVEDDDAVRRFSLFVLRNQGFRTLEAFDGESGLAAFLRHKHEVDLVLTDVVMPQCSGPEMVETLLDVDPSARVVFMSGTPECSELPEHLKKLPMLRKPFTADSLVEFVQQFLHGGGRSQG